jgi:LPXTG-site transpeptidase (sortase) family protein
VAIAGHRDTLFRALRKIRKDDEIIFTTTEGVYNYQVGSIEKVRQLSTLTA